MTAINDNEQQRPNDDQFKQKSVYDALLEPKRIQALSFCDRNLFSYNPNSFLLIFRLRGRHLEMIVSPLITLLVWDVLWATYWIHSEDPLDIREAVQSLEALISPLLIPVSFLLVFRLGRAAVRYWDARASVGKIVEICRALSSTALVACSAMPTAKAEPIQIKQRQVACDFIRWTAVFPIAVKNFLRPMEGADCNRRAEIGLVLNAQDREELLQAKSEMAFGTIYVLNKLRQTTQQLVAHHQQLSPIIYRQLNEHIDILTGAWGALERINSTPLPFVYVVHLRTFLMLYLFLWHVEALAGSGHWIALLPLLLASWGLLGIEAASVECERPFQWQSNHLALGKACIVVARNCAQTMENLGYCKAKTAVDRVNILGTLHSAEMVIKESDQALTALTEVAGDSEV